MELLKIKIKNIEYVKYPGSEFVIDGMINCAGDTFELGCASIRVLKDGADFTPTGTTWTGRHFGPFDVFEDVVNAYLRNDNTTFEFKYVCPEIEALKVSESDLILKQFYFDSVVCYHLDCKTDEYSFWIEDDGGEGCMIIDNEGKIMTNVECFYISGLCESVRNNEITFVNKKTFNLEQFIKDYDIIVKEKIS